jgi:hypothetical protein
MLQMEQRELKKCLKDIWESGGIAPTFLTSVLDGDEWAASRPGPFNLGEIFRGTHWIGGWLRPEAGVEAVVDQFEALSRCYLEGLRKTKRTVGQVSGRLEREMGPSEYNAEC